MAHTWLAVASCCFALLLTVAAVEADEDVDVAMHPVLQWLEERGGHVGPIVVRSLTEVAAEALAGDVSTQQQQWNGATALGYGVFAGRDIDEDEVLLRVPFDLLLNPEHSEQVAPSQIHDILGHLTHSPTNAAALQLLYQAYLANHSVTQGRQGGDSLSPATKRKLAPSDSLWGPYLHMLPTPAELTTPLWFTGDEWDMVAGTTLRRMTYRRRDATERSFRALFEERLHRFNGNAFPPAAFSLEAWRWALSIVWSRTHSVPMGVADDAPMAACLVPVGDLFNSDAGVPGARRGAVSFTTSKPDSNELVFEYRSTRSLAAGEEILVQYKEEEHPSCGELVLDYGFLPHTNLSLGATLAMDGDTSSPDASTTTSALPALACNVSVMVYLEVPDGDQRLADKEELLEELGLDRPHIVSEFDFVPDRASAGRIPKALLVTARIVAATPTELDELVKHQVGDILTMDMLSDHNERAAIGVLQKHVKAMLQRGAVEPSSGGAKDAQELATLWTYHQQAVLGAAPPCRDTQGGRRQRCVQLNAMSSPELVAHQVRRMLALEVRSGEARVLRGLTRALSAAKSAVSAGSTRASSRRRRRTHGGTPSKRRRRRRKA